MSVSMYAWNEYQDRMFGVMLCLKCTVEELHGLGVKLPIFTGALSAVLVNKMIPMILHSCVTSEW